jgi:hypothetical protein
VGKSSTDERRNKSWHAALRNAQRKQQRRPLRKRPQKRRSNSSSMFALKDPLDFRGFFIS